MNQRAVDERPRVGQDAQSDVSKNYMIRQNYQAFKTVNAKHHLPAKRLDGMHEAILRHVLILKGRRHEPEA